MPLVLGIDEAGRGPVIGDLVIAGTMIERSSIIQLEKLGVKDSKLLLPKKRVELFKKVKKLTKFKIISVSPKEIDEAVLDPGHMNLNWLEAVKTVKIIDSLKPDIAIIDCPTVNTSKYKDYIKKLLKHKKVKLIVENKADLNYVIVGAASILAKVTRDNSIEKLKKKYGDIGPGYPANEITKKFIDENWDKHPEIFRHSWATMKNKKKEKQQKSLNSY